jgi:hypothetical protein
VLIVAGLVVAARPGAVDAAQRAAASFFDRASYAAAVLERPAPRPASVAYAPISGLEVGFGVLTVVLAVGLTALLLRRRPISLPETLDAAFERLRRLHSGQTGDYIAWATVGFALFGALIAVAATS